MMKIESNELLVICPDDLSDEECMDIFNQFSGDDGLMDENEYHNFISSNSSKMVDLEF